MSSEKQVANKKSNLPSASLFEADAQMGFENVKTESLAPPILKLLQNGSSEAQKRNQNYVDGAEPGMFLNTVTKQLYNGCLLYTSPSPRDKRQSRMPSSA